MESYINHIHHFFEILSIQVLLFSIKNDNYFFNCILVYVDDLLLPVNHISEIQNIKSYIDKIFNIKDLCHLKYFLGFEIKCVSQGISLCKRKYTLYLLQECDLLASKSVSTPMDPTNNLHDATAEILYNPSAFRSLIG